MLWPIEPNVDPYANSETPSIVRQLGSTDLRVQVHQRLLEILNLNVVDRTPRSELREEIRESVSLLLAEDKMFLTQIQTDALIEDVLDELLGLGPLEPLLKDDSITDILINTHAFVYVERRGQLELTDVRFKDADHLMRIINKIVSAVGRRVDEAHPMVDARLADGSRINAIIPPLAVDGPLVSVRKFARAPIRLERMVELGTMNEQMAEALKYIVEVRSNVLISGGTGSGKTTLLNAMSAYINPNQRIVTIEDSAELQLQQKHVARLETRAPSLEGSGEITQRDLLKNALRMRPDRIIVGEVRGGEAFDMLQAMNTGHDGSMTTLHANSPRDALARLEQMVSMSGLDVPARAIRRHIADSINIVIQIERMEDGKRRVVSIYEIVGMEEEVVTMNEIYLYRRDGTEEDGSLIGEFKSSGIRPRFLSSKRAPSRKTSDSGSTSLRMERLS